MGVPPVLGPCYVFSFIKANEGKAEREKVEKERYKSGELARPEWPACV